MAEYIDRDAAIAACFDGFADCRDDCAANIRSIPAADVVEEENILKFYYVRSIDEYWIGRRIDNFYYAEYDPESCRWIWTHSRYLPWGKHIVSPTSLWKEHTYPSEPEEIPFEEWLQGFVKKHAADVAERKTGVWIGEGDGYADGNMVYDLWSCGYCGTIYPEWEEKPTWNYCPNCGAQMIGGDDDV